jgi:hypothetical protein
LLSIEREIYKVELQNRPTTFRSTVVKLYYNKTDKTKQLNKNSKGQQIQNQKLQEQDRDKEESLEQLVQQYPEQQYQVPICYNQFLNTFINKVLINTVFISNKEKLDIKISRKLQVQSIITTLEILFKILQKKEIDRLIAIQEQ